MILLIKVSTCSAALQVVLKIIKHCEEEGSARSELVQGVLLGLVENNRLEVTNCFPFPRHGEEEAFDEGKHTAVIYSSSSFVTCPQTVLTSMRRLAGLNYM